METLLEKVTRIYTSSRPRNNDNSVDLRTSRFANTTNASKNKKSVSSWYNKHVSKDESGSIISKRAYDHYSNHCQKQGAVPHSETEFNRKLSGMGIQKAKLGGRVRHIGISLKEDLAFEHIANTLKSME